MSTALIALRSALVLASFVAVALLAYVALPKQRVTVRHVGPRGAARARALAGDTGFSQLEPVLRWLAMRVSSSIPASLSASLERQIVLAGDAYGLIAAEVFALSGLLALGCAALGAAYGFIAHGGALFAPMGAVFGWLLPQLWLTSAAARRAASVRRELPHVVDLLVLSLGAGLDLPAALRQIVERAPEPASALLEELALVLQQLALGHTRQDAFRGLAGRVPSEELNEFIAAVLQSEAQGAPLARILQSQATASRMRRSAGAEEAAARAGAAMTLPVMLLFVCVLLLLVGPMVLEVLPQFRNR